jgi:hypothetical protein
MSTTRMPTQRAVESFTDLVTEMLDDAAHVTRVTTRAYLKGLDVLVAQHKLVRESSLEWAGELATAHGAREVAAPTTRSVRPVRSPKPTRRRSPRPSATATATAATPPRATRKADAGPASWTAEEYETLNATEIVEKLPGLSQRQLREVQAHEQAHQARQTVLQRLESLRGPVPMSGYDELTVPEVQAQLTAADAARATAIRDYERSHKKREGVLRAAQAKLDDA